MSNLLERYARVEEEVAAACRKACRQRSEVLLLAISKFQPVEAIEKVAQAGQKYFGENYVQEAFAKMEHMAETPLADKLQWHMVGHVQSRKAKQVAGAFQLIHTLDSEKLAKDMDRELAENGKEQNVLIEVNIASEPQKAGIMPGKVAELANHVQENCPRIKLRGLMCLPPVFDSGDAARPYFAKLRELRDNLSGETGLALQELSMGMSGDYAGAIAEGATIIRLGTCIFGPRPKKP